MAGRRSPNVLALVATLAACGTSPGTTTDASVDAADDPSLDAATTSPDAEPVASRCQVTATSVSCTHEITRLVAGTAIRDVYWQTPATPPPAGGYPVVIVYQGSLAGPSLTWGTLTPSVPFGGFHQGRLQASLLDHGFTVIAPEAAGGSAWQTNSGLPYDLSTDQDVIEALLAAIANDEFGPADEARLYATGISSGGYMTSRMAVSHGGTFRALAIHSASYATCLGALCNVPSALPADHPPTLFLHGTLDTTVPLYTAESYYAALVASAVETQKVVDPDAGHEWLEVSPAQITAWFTTH